MKILEITPIVSISEIDAFKTSNSGFGLIVYDIIKGLAKNKANTIEVLTIHKFHREILHNNILFKNTNLLNTLLSFPYLEYINIAKEQIERFSPSVKSFSFKSILYYALLFSHIDKEIRRNKYQLIHVHGCAFYLDFIFHIADKYNIPVITTLHGLNSFNTTIKCDIALKEYERYFLIKAYKEHRVVSFVSSGCINRIMSEFKFDNISTFYSINNGYDVVKRSNTDFNIRTKYGLPNDAYIVLYIGNIGINKNQVSIIDGFQYLDETIRKKIYILFCGGFESKEYELEFKNKIKNNLEYSHFIVCGWIDNTLLHNYYNQANATALLSFSEGFGLSIIEGMAYGLPAILVKDMDIIPDIFDAKCMICIENRDSYNVANGILNLYQNNWDRSYIQKVALAYSKTNMIKKYNSLFNKVLKKE